jgi:hypothetical protein
MTEPLPDTWNDRDLPVLRAIVRRLEEKPVGGFADIGDIAAELGLSWDDVRRAAANLDRAGLVTVGGFAELPIAYVADFSAKALEEVGPRRHRAPDRHRGRGSRDRRRRPMTAQLATVVLGGLLGLAGGIFVQSRATASTRHDRLRLTVCEMLGNGSELAAETYQAVVDAARRAAGKPASTDEHHQQLMQARVRQITRHAHEARLLSDDARTLFLVHQYELAAAMLTSAAWGSGDIRAFHRDSDNLAKLAGDITLAVRNSTGRKKLSEQDLAIDRVPLAAA